MAQLSKYDRSVGLLDKSALAKVQLDEIAFCPNCQMHGNSDRNASLNVGKRLLARYQQNALKEKPHTLRCDYGGVLEASCL